jgi:hypothetical protein
MMAGALAGISEHVIIYPLDVLKTRLQVLTSGKTGINTIYAQEGFGSLWRGLNSVLLGSGPAHALYFGSYEFFKSVFTSLDTSEHQHISHAAAGAIATVAHDGFITPFDGNLEFTQW